MLPEQVDNLGAAWAEAEAALPEGWTLTLERMSHGRYMVWVEPPRDRNSRMSGATAPTPAAALRALTKKLRGAE